MSLPQEKHLTGIINFFFSSKKINSAFKKNFPIFYKNGFLRLFPSYRKILLLCNFYSFIGFKTNDEVIAGFNTKISIFGMNHAKPMMRLKKNVLY